VPEANVFMFQNDSQNASSYFWDFGNGTTSTEKSPTLKLPDAGTYTISLTVTNKDGKTSVTKKQIKVVAPIMTAITIKILDLSISAIPNLPKISKADVWVEVKVSDRSVPPKYLENGTYDRALFYKTAVYSNAVSTKVPIVFNVSERKVLAHYILDKSYAYERYARDATGTYLLYSTDHTGSSFLGSLESDHFSWVAAFGSFVEVSGHYE
jgi:PKD repeat protein